MHLEWAAPTYLLQSDWTLRLALLLELSTYIYVLSQEVYSREKTFMQL